MFNRKYVIILKFSNFSSENKIYYILVKKRAGDSNHMDQWKIHICSENNFPTSAGLASSAAGYACLVIALAKLYEVKVFQNK